MSITIRNANGDELDVSEEMFTQQYEAQGYERVDKAPTLEGMTRDELNAHAAEAGVADPESYPNKAALVEAINANQVPQSPVMPGAPEAPQAPEAAGDGSEG